MTRHLTRLSALVGALALIAGSMSVTPAALGDSSPASTGGLQQAEAIGRPSVVFIETQWTGYLTNATFNGANVAAVLSGDTTTAPKLTVTTSCTGFLANPEGYVVTAAHCVDDKSMSFGGPGLIVQQAVTQLATKVTLSEARAREIVAYGYKNWVVEGEDKGSPPDRTVKVFVTKGTSGNVGSAGLVATVVNFRSFDKGDVAVLKVTSSTPLPAAELADPSTVTDGMPIVAMGYPGSVLANVDASSQPSMKDGTISGTQTVAGAPFTEISAATSPGMSGGPVFDMHGKVIGTVSWKPGTETQSFNFITATSSVRDILASNSVSNKLNDIDIAYRAGIADYFGGQYHAAVTQFDKVLGLEPDHAGAQEYRRLAVTNYPNEKVTPASSSVLPIVVGGVVLLVVVAGVILLLVRRRRTPQAAVVAPTNAGPAPSQPWPTPTTAEWPAYASAPTYPPAPPGQPAAPTATGKRCPRCGVDNRADAHFCSQCGYPFPGEQQPTY